MIHLHTTSHVLSSSGSLIITIKPKTKYSLHAAAMLFFYSLQKITTPKVAYTVKMYYCTSFQYSKLRGVSGTYTLQVCTSAILLMFVEN